jgi:hypothetical protein
LCEVLKTLRLQPLHVTSARGLLARVGQPLSKHHRFQLAMARAHARTFAVSATPGNAGATRPQLRTPALILMACTQLDGEGIRRISARSTRKAGYVLLRASDRRFIKGQKYTLLSHRDNLSLDDTRSLALLLAANKRLNTAHVPKEAFGQVRNHRREDWARRFFDNWRTSLRWQRFEPDGRLAGMIDRHWDGSVLEPEEQGLARLGRGDQQQGPGLPAACLRTEERDSITTPDVVGVDLVGGHHGGCYGRW